MVSRRRNRRGQGTLGCLAWIAGFAAVCFYGFHIGQVYFKYFRLQDAMRSQARLAPSLTDDVIRRRLHEESNLILDPAKPLRFRIQRTDRPRRIVIEAQYTDSVRVPLFHHTFTFKPRAEEAL
jgi:hypothetical protein